MAAMPILAGEQRISPIIAQDLFCIWRQLQRMSQTYRDVGQMHQGDRIVTMPHVRIGFSAFADGVEKVRLVVSGHLRRFLGTGVVDPFVALTVDLEFSSLTDQHASRGAMEFGAAVAIERIVHRPQTHFED